MEKITEIQLRDIAVKVDEIVDWINEVIDLDKTLELPEEKPRHVPLTEKQKRQAQMESALED